MAAPAERMPAAEVPRRPRRTTRVRARSRTRDRLEYLALRLVVGVLGLVPLALALRVGAFAGLLAYALDRRHRAIGTRNLALAFPEKTTAERRGILRRSFANLGRMAAELAHLPRLSADRLRRMVRFADEA